MRNKRALVNIVIGSIVLGLADAYLYTFDGLSFISTFIGFTVLSLVVMLFLISFMPSRNNRPARAQNRRSRTEKNSRRKQPVNQPKSGEEDNARLSGHIKWYDPRKGFGFLVYGNQEIFFHRQAIRTRHHQFQELDPILFHLGESDKGPQATAIWYNKEK